MILHYLSLHYRLLILCLALLSLAVIVGAPDVYPI